ncbi:unnamed protein product [Allacma fusca]|uniref:Uncharacterized protein n=1 Tax=Allacma fusca TaxID=39272 RepID=A0A8J2L8H7_9HEXA|nr:unnamed protein product [Allacma fusca]
MRTLTKDSRYSNCARTKPQRKLLLGSQTILNAEDEYADQEAAWIAQNHPAKPIVIKPCSIMLWTVLVLLDKRRNQEQLRSQLPPVLEEEDVDILLLMDEDPIPLPPTMLQMWTTRAHCKSVPIQEKRPCIPTEGS